MALSSSQNIGILFCLLSMARDIEKGKKRIKKTKEVGLFTPIVDFVRHDTTCVSN